MIDKRTSCKFQEPDDSVDGVQESFKYISSDD